MWQTTLSTTVHIISFNLLNSPTCESSYYHPILWMRKWRLTKVWELAQDQLPKLKYKPVLSGSIGQAFVLDHSSASPIKDHLK